MEGIQGWEERVGLATSEWGQDSNDAKGQTIVQALWHAAHLPLQLSTPQQSKRSSQLCSCLSTPTPSTKQAASRALGCEGPATLSCE